MLFQSIKSFLYALVTAIVVMTLPAQAGPTTEDLIDTGGKLGKLSADVLQDFAFDGLDAEASGKARWDAFWKDKIKGDAKNLITGGDDLSAEMGTILNKIYERINTADRTTGGRQGVCQKAALNEARAIAFDAKNVRLLRGAANIWFDTITAIPGAPALAEKLVTDIGKAGYDKIRSKMEDLVKQHYTSGRNETFKYSRSTGACTISMTVIWNKKRGKYLFIIKGDCKCNEVNAAGPFESAAPIQMRGFQLIGGGNVSLRLNVKNPEKPELKVYIGTPQIQLNADCRCELIIEDPPPPPPEEKPIELSLHEGIFFKDKLRCEACADEYAELEFFAQKTREYAGKMNEVALRVNQEKFDTADRRKDIQLWNQYWGLFNDWHNKFDKLYPAYVKCEETECKLTDPISLPLRDSMSPVSTTCDECIPLVNKTNEAVKRYNALVSDMNGVALLANKLKHGTKDGNKLYRDWQKKDAELKKISAEVDAGKKEKRSCEAKYCFGRKPWEKRKLTSACEACSVPQQRLNQAEKEYNEMVDKLNAADQKYQEFLMAGGDPATKKGNEMSHASIAMFDEFNKIADRMYKLARELWKCHPSQCDVAATDDTRIKIGEEVKTEPLDEATSNGSDETKTGDKKIALDADCLGQGCPQEPIIGSCTGDTCPATIKMTCDETLCPEIFQLDCSTSPCPDNVSIDCDALGCFAQQIDFSFAAEDADESAQTDLADENLPEFRSGHSGLVEGRFGYYQKVYRKVSTRCTDPECQALVTRINGLIDELEGMTTEYETARAAKNWTQTRAISDSGLKLGRTIEQLIANLAECVKKCDVEDTTIQIGEDFVLAPGTGYSVNWGATSGYGTGTASPASGLPSDALSQRLSKLPPSDCRPCNVYVNSYNQTINEIAELQSRLRKAVEEQRQTQRSLSSDSKLLERMQNMDQATFEQELFDWDFMDQGTTVDSYRAEVRQSFNQRAARLLVIASTIEELKQQIDDKQNFLQAIKLSLTACEQQCARVVILNVINLFGNFPYNRLDPLSQDGESGNASEPTVLVVNNIPIIRLSLAGPEPVSGPIGCALSHYHGSADNCNGVFTVDPNPPGCGHGTVAQVVAIPVSACPDL